MRRDGIVALIGLFGLPGASAGADRPVVDMRVECSAAGDLTGVTIGKRRFSVPIGRWSRASIEALVPDKQARLRITNMADTPYRCIGGLIYTLQRYGYLNITFIAEPPR